MPATEALAEEAAVFVAGERPLLAELEDNCIAFSLAQDFPEGTFEVDFSETFWAIARRAHRFPELHNFWQSFPPNGREKFYCLWRLLSSTFAAGHGKNSKGCSLCLLTRN